MPVCVIKSRTIKIFLAMAVVVVLLALSFEGGACAQVWFGYSTRLVPVYRVDTQEKQVAISFDAAWGADKTEEILSVLEEYEVGATFFLVGFWVDKYPEMVQKIDEAGFEIGSHSNTHPDMANLSSENIAKELDISVEKIKAITGKDVTVFRPPYGSYSNDLINACSSRGLIAVQWDVDSLDWKGLSATDVTTRVMNNVQNGSIILMHNNADNVVQSTRMVLERLTKEGYKITSVGDLIYHSNYSIDRNGVQHSN